MDELFGNLIYLIPIALVIVRIVSAAGNSKKKPPQDPSAHPSETPRRVSEQGMDPGMREFLRNFGVETSPAPPAAPKPRKKAVKEKPKKEPAKAPSLFPEIQETAEQAGDPGLAARTEPRGPLPAGLSPLQQGFVWAEILGPAKAME